MTSNGEYEPVIGLEVHAQLLTSSKAFCGCSTAFGGDPNTSVCPVCLGMPGTLPVLNRNLVEYILRMGIAVHSTISPRSVFARKNYFYPDLPKGYQISQYDNPICRNGSIAIDAGEGGTKEIGITRIHMEEDAGKLIHDQGRGTLLDANRCGVPLIEIVSEPDLRSPREAYLFLTAVRQLVTYLGICDGNMEEGSLRCDANVSIRRRGESALGTKTEVKNMNSFRNVERALEFEIGRQIGLIREGERVVQETLLWDADGSVAVPMRSKEEAHDYRYFPDPDLVPVAVDEPWLERIRSELPELPRPRRDRFVSELGLPQYDADVLTAEKPVADYFEATLAELVRQAGGAEPGLAKLASNWVMTEILRLIGERKESVIDSPVTPANLGSLIGMVREGTISGTIAREVFGEMAATGADPRGIVERRGMAQISDEGKIEAIISDVLAKHHAQVSAYLAGNERVFGFLVGETMKLSGGKANPRIVNELLRKKLSTLKG